jgi:hypothetical protein
LLLYRTGENFGIICLPEEGENYIKWVDGGVGGGGGIW